MLINKWAVDMNEQWNKCYDLIFLFNCSETCCIYPVVSSFWYTVLCGEQEGNKRKSRYISEQIFLQATADKIADICYCHFIGKKGIKKLSSSFQQSC